MHRRRSLQLELRRGFGKLLGIREGLYRLAFQPRVN